MPSRTLHPGGVSLASEAIMVSGNFGVQENATVTYKSFIKKWRTDEYEGGTRKHKGFVVRTEEKPGRVSGTKTVYYTERSFAKPMQVTQFYPANGPVILTTRSSFSS